MNRPLMPKATALWLMKHTRLTRAQIGRFCMIHPLEMDVLAQGQTLQENDPIATGQLSAEDIARCETDPQADLQLLTAPLAPKKKQRAYVPLAKRSEIPHAVFWMIKTYPQLPDTKICALLPTTKTMVKGIREGTYWNIKGLSAKNPILLGLCAQEDVEKAVEASTPKPAGTSA